MTAPKLTIQSWPRRMTRITAAAYLDTGLTSFDLDVKNGQLPEPRWKRGKTPYWDKVVLDAFLDGTIDAKHAGADTPAAAKHFIGFFNKMFEWAVDQDLMSNNPATGIKPLKYEKRSHATWTKDQLAAYRKAHPKGTTPRLAFEIMFWTGFRVSDATRFGRQHIKASGEIELSQRKTKQPLIIPFPAPLAEYLDIVKHGHMVFLISSHGRPFTSQSLRNQFATWCDKANLPNSCVAHGLRHTLGADAANAGASLIQIQHLLG